MIDPDMGRLSGVDHSGVRAAFGSDVKPVTDWFRLVLESSEPRIPRDKGRSGQDAGEKAEPEKKSQRWFHKLRNIALPACLRFGKSDRLALNPPGTLAVLDPDPDEI